VKTWPEPVERVARFLRESGTEARIEQFSEGTPTAADAARVAGAKLEQIVKSLVFVCDGRYVLALVPGDRRANGERIAAAVGAKRARVAGAEEVEDATGFTPGAVAPFPLRRIDTVLVERRLLVHDHVWVGAGSERHLAMIAPGDLVRLTRARAADLIEQEPRGVEGRTQG
jgi:Cys-tRNA(Pro) deacylase